MQIDQDIYEAATDWLLMIEDDPTVLESAAFEGWLYASNVHMTAFADVSDSWDTLAPAQLGLAAYCLVLWRRLAGLWHGLSFPAPRRAGFALASVVAFACLAAVYVTQGPATDTPVYYSAALGEIRTIELADNSTLYVDTGTSAKVLQTAENRIVDLEHGRVFVDVNGADHRVFKVTAGRMAFTATGTAYSVRALDVGYQLDVYEGTVEIRRDNRLLGCCRRV